MDIFGKLNDFLQKDDDSFQYDCVDSPGSEQNPNEKEKIDAIEDSRVFERRYTNRKSPNVVRRKRRARNISREADESFDLTNDFVPNSHGVSNTGRSRRKLADEIPVTHVEEVNLVNLCDSPILESSYAESQSIENTTTRGRGRRGRRGAPRTRPPKKVSYRNALAVLHRPIIDICAPPATEQPIVSATSSRRRQNTAVDLTGDIALGPQHSHAPLFQKPTTIQKKPEREKQDKSNNSLDLGESDDIDTITINVRIRDPKDPNERIKTYKHKQSERFYELFKKIADSQDVPVSHIFLFVDEKRIYPDCTPDSIGHRISTIYTCKIVDASTLTGAKKDRIELKFQSDKWKRPIVLKVSRVDTFYSFLIMLCEQIDFKVEQISLSFDGDAIDVQSTPMDNDFEGGEILDCRIKI